MVRASRLIYGTLAVLCGWSCAWASEQSDGGQPPVRTIRCESVDGLRAYCAADLEGYRLTEVRQTGETPCHAGWNFGFDGEGVWVNGGCRAEFVFTSAPVAASDADDAGNEAHASDGPVRCESPGRKRIVCPADGAVRVRLVRQLSRAPCREGETWGLGPRGIWVDGGCRGEFEIVTRLAAAP